MTGTRTTSGSSPAVAVRPKGTVKYRGIVIAHGVGEAGKGDYIDSFVEPLAAFVGEAVGYDRLDLEVNNSDDSSTWATMRIKDSNGNDLEEWHVREAWWAKSFKPSRAPTVLFWGILAGLTILWATFQTIFFRGILTALPKTGETASFPAADKAGRPLDPSTGDLEVPDNQGVWQLAKPGIGKAALDAVVWLLVVLGYTLAATVGLILIIPLYVFLLLPLSLIVPGPATTIQRKIVGVLVRSIGDQQAMSTRRFALSAASNEISRALWIMLAPEGIAYYHGRNKSFTGFDTVTVVCHSGGALVSFDALATQVTAWMQEPLDTGLKRPKRVNWITAGSGLNLSFRMRRRKDGQETAYWHRQPAIGSFVNWLNIYARYDPVPQGAAPVEMMETILGARDLWIAKPRNTKVARPPFVALRVVNHDFPGTDHFGYWRNSEEVMSRVVAMIVDDTLATQPVDPQRVVFPSTIPPELAQHIETQTAAGGRHRRKVLARQLVVYGAMSLLLVALPWYDNVGRWVLGQASFLGLDPLGWRGNHLESAFPEKLAGINILPVRSFLAGASVLGLLALALGQIVTLFMSLIKWYLQGGSLRLVLFSTLWVVLSITLVAFAVAWLT